MHGAAEGLTVVSAEELHFSEKVPALDEHAFARAAVGKVGLVEAEADLPAEVAVLRAVGRAALRQKIGERAAEFLLCEKRGELRAARIVRRECKARVLRLRRAEMIAENGLTLCDVRFAERLKRHRPRVNERGEDE